MGVTGNGESGPHAEPELRRVIARVSLEPAARREAVMRLIEEHPDRERWAQRFESQKVLRLHIHLSLETGDGRRLATSLEPDLGVVRAGPEEVAEAVDQLLGRDPDLHRPPRLGWGGVLARAAEAGVRVSERDLIALPLDTTWDEDSRRAASALARGSA